MVVGYLHVFVAAPVWLVIAVLELGISWGIAEAAASLAGQLRCIR